VLDRKTVEGWNLKRLAWAFGCSKRGSAEEAQLEEALILRVLERPQRHAQAPEPDPYASSQDLE
jgi:hypothetical protein